MSILIKGMKMPEKCGSCDLFHVESPMHCTVVKGHKTVGAPYGMPRPDWCPLVEIPEPHWIPVSERLPETEEFVLASLTGKYRNTTFEHACEIADYADGEWCVYAYPHMSAEKCEELIEAWMPLPKPFEGGIK